MMMRALSTQSKAFVDARIVHGPLRILQFVAPTTKGAESAESLTELGTNGLLHRVVTALCRWPKALLREECRQCLTSCVVRENECGVGITVDRQARGFQRGACLGQQPFTLGGGTGEPLEMATGDEALHLVSAALPPGHEADSLAPASSTVTWLEALICATRASVPPLH